MGFQITFSQGTENKKFLFSPQYHQANLIFNEPFEKKNPTRPILSNSKYHGL